MRTRDKQMKIWLTEKEKQSIENKARRAGLPVSGYLLMLTKGHVPKDAPPPDYYGMMRELRAIGNSVNQIAARANATGFFLADQYAELMSELNKNIILIQEAVTKPGRMRYGNDKDMEG